MRHLPETDRIVLLVLDISIPILGYWYMRIIERGVKKVLITKVLDKGFYKYKPVTGDAVIPIAYSFRRSAIIIFAFSIVFSLLGGVFLYTNW